MGSHTASEVRCVRRLGHGLQCLSEEVPRVVLSLAESTTMSVACGFAHTAALAGDGSVYTFGLNDAGQLGHSHDAPFTPVRATPFHLRQSTLSEYLV